ncbi:MAG TPA: LysR family transcriptional regulator [Steroidobacteraceae bacterium]|nr:LysR family transcriptional regulator [Steroidobacteraceae bacterium]
MTVQMPNLRHLSVLSSVAQLGSVSAAARAAHLSQPAVTQAIASLEREFGQPLFSRTAQGMSPTEAGRLCSQRVTRVLERIVAAIAAAAAQSQRARPPLQGITSGQLLALLAVVEAGGFGAAARSRELTRATLHRAARALERRIGTPLFETTSHGLRPTREALRLCRQLQLAVAELAQARAEVAALEGTERGETVIGAMPLARSFIVPETILRFTARWTSHQISILDGPYESLLDALRNGRADILVGALRESVPADIVQELLFEDPLAIIVRKDHPLAAMSRAGRRAPPPEALVRFPWIAPRSGSPLRRHFERLFRGTCGLPPAAVIECNSLIAARALLLHSDRAMLLSAQQAHHELAAGELTALPHPAGRVVREIGLTLRRDWRPTTAQAELLDTLRKVGRGNLPFAERLTRTP